MTVSRRHDHWTNWLAARQAHLLLTCKGTVAMTDPEGVTEADPIQDHVNEVVKDLIGGKTSKPQRQQIGRALDQAERVSPTTNSGLGRATGHSLP